VGTDRSTFTTARSAKECADGFRTAVERDRPLVWRALAVDWYAPQCDSPLALLDERRFDLAVGANMGDGAKLEMGVKDHGDHRDVTLTASWRTLSAVGIARNMRKLMSATTNRIGL
jgi:hypothetical protein